MPSIEQCDSASGNIAALPSTLEIFDKFKCSTDNGKDSDSEESFHLPLDDDDMENQSVVSNGRDKEIINEETEDDILNKFDTVPSGTPDHLDPHTEDSILNDDNVENARLSPTESGNQDSSTTALSHTKVEVKYSFEGYEDSGDGEFKSFYETDDVPAEAAVEESKSESAKPSETVVELMEISEEPESDTTQPAQSELPKLALDTFEDTMEVDQDDTNQDIANIIEKLEDPDTPMEEAVKEDGDVNMTEKTTDNDDIPDKTVDKENMDDVEMTGVSRKESTEAPVTFRSTVEASSDKTETGFGEVVEQTVVNNDELQEKNENIVEDGGSSSSSKCDVENNKKLEEPVNNENEQESTVNDYNVEKDELLEELDKTINGDTVEQHDNVKEVEAETKKDIKEPKMDTIKDVDADTFKAPLVVSPQKEDKEAPDLQSEKSNDKTEDDESELLDISMVRETEEDDACAIADALEDKDAGSSEKSDEEQSEKVETEQEGSDVDKDNDNEPMEFDDDFDSHADSADHDESSNAESNVGGVKDKIISVSESSKDSAFEDDVSKSSKTLDGDAANDGTIVLVVDEGEDSDKTEVAESIAPDASLNLESTLVESNEDPVNEEKEEPAVPATSGEESKGVEESAKTDEVTTSAEEESSIQKEGGESPSESVKPTEATPEKRKSQNKRTLATKDIEETEVISKKPKLASTINKETQNKKQTAEKLFTNAISDKETANEKIKTLTAFTKFMQSRQLTAKLSRSDLEQFCIQKICECLMLKSSEGELQQANKKHEKTIDNLRKDMQQLTKQCKDLEIVNKKLMNELRSQNVQKKPLVPLKITRSVGLQVRLNPGNETPNQNRRRQVGSNVTPQKQIMSTPTGPVNQRVKTTVGNVQQPAAVRQVLQNSPQKSPLTAGQTTTNASAQANQLLSQALQQNKARPGQQVVAKRTAGPVRKQAEVTKPAGNPGVIDLTDEDDRLAATKTIAGSTIKIMNKTASPGNASNKTLLSKVVPGKNVTNQGKQVGVQKAVTVGNKGTTLSTGIRLTPTSVITSSANGSPQMVYVVPTLGSNAGGTQKLAFVNFQPTNGVLSGALNGSTVSVMSNKGQTLTLKTVPSVMRNKHPASLPPPPRINPDPKLKPLLPKPLLTIKKIDTGIILQWKMPYDLENYENIASYQLYAYQETNSPPNTEMWRKVGDVKALALPMACTLTQFADKNKYYFAVRSVDVHKRIGAFSDPEEISL